jgi:putative ABC transport system substrate-binding protein
MRLGRWIIGDRSTTIASIMKPADPTSRAPSSLERRRFVTIIAISLLAAPLSTQAQQVEKVARIGWLSLIEIPSHPGRSAFLAGLRELGWVEGQNLVIEIRSAEGKRERVSELAAELVGLRLDVIVGAAPFPAQALMRATKTIPIVFAAAGDPVGDGMVASLARPGGNVTGSSFAFEDAFSGKWVELLTQAIPKASRLAVLVFPTDSRHGPLMSQARLTARALSVELQPYEARGPDEFAGALSKMTRDHVDGLIVFPHNVFAQGRGRLVELVAKHRLPAIYEHKQFTEAGGLLSYGPNPLVSYHRAAFYVDRILKGAKPGDLPVEQPTKFELVINLKTAKALGLTIPPSLLGRADEVIQ